MKLKLNTDAPILIVLGQSNAHGHATLLDDTEKITIPQKNVFGLSQKFNQAYGLSKVTWEGFVSSGMNLGETQDHTCCIANILAKKWQEMVDAGSDLPDLHIIGISIGAQGIAKVEKYNNDMWYPKREKVLKNGVWPELNISLYPLTLEILALAMKDLRQRYKNPQIIGLHWNQWETEADTSGLSISDALKNYTELFAGFGEAIGQRYPLYLYRPLSDIYGNPDDVDVLNRIFNQFAAKNADTHVIDISTGALFDCTREDKGIFQSDNVHYSKEAQQWFAEYQLNEIIEQNCGKE